MEYKLDPRGSTLHIVLKGAMYVEDAGKLREEAIALLGQHPVRTVDVDLSGLNYIDSAGLGVLISLHKRCARNGGHLAVRGLSGAVKELFEITRLDRVFPQQA